MLGQRLIVSVVLIPGLILLLAWDHSLGAAAPVLLVTAVLLAGRSAWELSWLLRTRSLDISWPLVLLGSTAVIWIGWSNEYWNRLLTVSIDASRPLERVLLVFAVVVVVLFVNRALRFREPGGTIAVLGAEVLVVAYCGVLLAVTAQLRWTPKPELGYLALGALIVATKMGDTGAYTLGKLFGRRKMCPRLSPGKTWMGALGAVLGATLGAVLWLRLAGPVFATATPGWTWCLAFGALMGISGLLGDLCESMLKRDAEVKDSAELLPGMGGVLDLLDSVLLAGPIAYLFWRLWPPLGG